MPNATHMTGEGKIVQIIGPVVDAAFEEGSVPEIYHALTIAHPDGREVTCEVARHWGSSRIRAIALASTDGLTRGMTVKNTGAQISVSVGRETLGRIFNVLSDPIDRPAHDLVRPRQHGTKGLCLNERQHRERRSHLLKRSFPCEGRSIAELLPSRNSPPKPRSLDRKSTRL